jgi:hypothetical protein
MTEDPARRRLSDRELTQLQEMGRVKTLGGFTLASLIASLNELGIGPEDVEIVGTGDAGKYGVELCVIEPDGEDQ